jgi:glycosyltransferase involved in cell wall biosynthesis
MDGAEKAAPRGSGMRSAAASEGARAAGRGADAVVTRAAPYVTDDATIAAAAQDIAGLAARVGSAVGAAKRRISAADAEIAALREQGAAAQAEIASLHQRLAASEREIALLRRQRAEAEAATESWRQDFNTSNRMLIDALDRVALRVIAAAEPDPSADAALPEVSIVMPVWNRADLIGTAIRSVLAQSFRAWELIVIDDGSTDDLDGSLRPLLVDPRIRLVRQANAGECKARNHALRLARGEVIAYLDSDNFWYPDFLDAAVRVFRADPELDIAYGGIAYEWPNGDVRFYLLPFERAQLLRDNLADMNVILHRRRAYERHGGFDETLARAVEWDLMLRYTAERPAARIPIVGARYRIADQNRVSQNRPLADSVFRIRRKWWARPAAPPRVLYAVFQFPQLSESHVYAEIACMRRFGAEVQVWAPAAGAAPFAHDLHLHRGPLGDAIRIARPDLVHVHWLSVLEENLAALAAADLPLTVRGHSFDATPQALAAALRLSHLRHAYLLPGSAADTLPQDTRVRFVAPIFDSTLFAPAAQKDRRLVLRASPGLPQNNLRFMLDLARLLPQHRVMVAVASATGHAAEIEALKAYKAETGSPAELLFDVPRREIAALFGAAGIYVHSSTAPEGAVHKRVGGPVSIAEAMATGAYVLARDTAAFARYVGDAGATYADAAEAAALIRTTEAWSDAQWQAASRKAIERAFTHHADEIVLRPVFEDWCAIARERDAARAVSAPGAT